MRASVLVILCLLGGLQSGCNSAPRLGDEAGATRRPASASSPAPHRASASAPASAPVAPSSAAPAATPPAFSVREAEDLLFPDGAPADLACTSADRKEAILCLVAARYASDPRGAATARDLFARFGSVAGIERAHTMNGGFRGSIRIVSELPVGKYQKHFDWVAAGESDHNRFMERLERAAPGKLRYRVSPIGYKFMRSVGRTTPSAYAQGWRVGYNVSGSLHSSAEAVRDTLFHEVFHLNDEAHDDWSRRVLGARYDRIVARCGTRIACLTPYAPMKTMVRGGTYYAFQPDNGDGVHEYGAELATRYFRETLAALDGKPYGEASFKCGPPENMESFRALADEFFGGVDLTPPCK